MARIDRLRRSAPLDEVGQAVRFNQRERRKSLLDPTFELHRTHVLLPGDPVEAASFSQSVREDVITARVKLLVTGSTSGNVFLIGGNAGGEDVFGIIVAGASAVFFAGRTLTSTARAIFTDNTLLQIRSRPYDIVMSAIPGTGELRVWEEGREIGRARSTDGDFGDPSIWATNAEGLVNDSISGAEIVGGVSIYARQRPRQFDSEV